MKVLLVEDDPMVAFINKEYLEKIGNVKVFGPVMEEKDIIQILDKEEIDLILLDVFLPKKSGIEILGNLRKKKYLVDVIIISAANKCDEIRQAFAYGVVDYLIKPFNFERFEEAINKYKIRHDLLKNEIPIKQKDIDIICSNNKKCSKFNELPKGLNKATLENLLKFLGNNSNNVWTLRKIANEVNLSNVTVKKYMDYLEEIDKVYVETTYGNIGRPELRYDLIKNKK